MSPRIYRKMWTLALAVIFLVQGTAFALPDVCSENVEISEDCVCSNTVCGVSSTCVNGTTCTPACNENEKISEECMCSNDICGLTSSCMDGTTCMAACSANAEISEECVCSNEVCGANHTCASGLTCAQGWEQVTDLNKQIPEFLFDCLTKKDHWISPCSELRKYFMIFDSQGNFFQERRNRSDSSKYLRSFTKKARKPRGMQMIEIAGHPNYLFQLEEVDQKKGTFYIGTNATGSGQLLVAGNEVNPSLLLREDHCGKDSRASATESPAIASTATASPDPSVTVAPTESPVTVIASIATASPDPSVTISGITTTASTEPSATIASITTVASTESPVTNITTVASTESPVTAIAISTPSPNMDYGCIQAQWRLWKVDRRFLLIESVNKPGYFLNVDSLTHKVMLGMPEKLSGIHTSFISHMTLDRSAGEQAELGIGAEAYGDVVVHYLGRNGSQHSGYVCDYEWGQKSADSVCKHLGFGTGIPTYDGRYSSTNTPEYAVSEVKCDSENLEECKVRTICGTSSSCLGQNSMKAFGGKGYACNRGSATDVAGVVCGDQAQILNVLKEEVTCNRASLGSDRKSVASMFSIAKQIKTVRSNMFGNKHWSEYLLPMPMAVSLIAALLLVSSQNDRAVELVKPAVGEWVHLKHIYLKPNLLLLSQHVEENFVLSNNNMGVIKVNTKEIHINMKQALRNAFSSSSYDYKTRLPRNLERIAADAVKNKELAEGVCAAFDNTKQIINELVQALQSTKDYQTNKKADTEKAIKVLNTTYEKDKNEYEEKKVLKKEYVAAVKTSRKAYFDAAKAAMNTKCVEANPGDGYGVAECNNCIWRKPVKTDECKPNKTETVCVEWNDPVCIEKELNCVEKGTTCTEFKIVCSGGYETICSGHKMECAEYGTKCIDLRCEGTDNGCCTEGNPCGHGEGDCDTDSQCQGDLECGNDNCQWGDGDDCCTGGSCKKECLKHEKICQNPKVVCKKEEERCLKQESVCNKEEQVCKRTAPQKCNTTEHVCNEYVYDPPVGGSYCQDDRGQVLGKCTSCKWIAEVQKTLNNVMDITVKMQNSVMNDETSYSEVAHVTDDLVKQVAKLDQDVQNYQKWKSISQLVPSVDNVLYDEYNEFDEYNGTKTMNNESQSSNPFIGANANIDSMLKLMKLSVDLKIDLLSQMKLPIAKKSSHYTIEVKDLLENLITRKVKKVVEMTENEKMSITTLHIKGKTILTEAKKLKTKHEVEIKKSSVGGDAKTGEQASILMENLSNRHKTEKVIESLANRMSNAIREMFKQDLEKQDINTVITKLIACYRYLNFLNEQWLQLRVFFMKLTNILNRLEITIKEMSNSYRDMGVKIPRSELSKSKTFKEDLKRSVVKALSNNMFVRRVAHFYTKISEDGEEDGLLTKMALIGTYLQKIDDPKMYEKIKKYIDDESVMMQDRIKLEVSKAEAKANDGIMKDILSIENDLSCNLKDVDSLSDETVIAVVSYQKARNDQVNVNKTSISEASSAEAPSVINELGNDLKKTVDGIENNELGPPEDDDVDYNELGDFEGDDYD